MGTQKYLLDKVRCPYCIKAEKHSHRENLGLLTMARESWLVCQECERKYPIVDIMPVLTIHEGEKWIDTSVAELPVPPVPAG